jgi:hypothetical protein
MRFRFLLLIVLLLGAAAGPAAAQGGCGADDLNQQLDSLIEAYQEARADGAYQAAQDLAEELDTLLTTCAPPDLPQAGEWQFTWLSPLRGQCSTTISPVDRRFIMLVDEAEGQFSAEDVFVANRLDFTLDEGGDYVTSFNTSFGNETLTLEINATLMSDSRLSGVATAFLPSEDCALAASIEMQLVDTGIICLVGSLQSVNLRVGPGTDFDRAGTIPVNQEQAVVGQATGSDDFTWWQLENGRWVRSDVVTAAGDCRAVPVVSP